MTVDLCEGEVLAAINSLDTYSRIWMGQFDHLVMTLHMWRWKTCDWDRKSRICEELLMGMRALFLPDAAVLGRGASLGIWSDKVNELAVCAYDVQQVMRHDWSWFKEPEGDSMSRWFDEPYLHGSLPVPSTECHVCDDGSPAMRLSAEDTTLRLLLDAALAYRHLLNLRINAMMRLFTQDGRVLVIAQMVEDILSDTAGDVHDGLHKLDEDLEGLIGRISPLVITSTGKAYRSLALEREDNGEPLAYGERRVARSE